MLLSIVIPVYKVEKYIAGTLSSIYNQHFDENEFEVVVVDDGTPDKSMQVVDFFATMHRNMRVLHQENQGLSAARNTGFDNAKGDYVWFVDSDDTITNESLSIVQNAIQEMPGCDFYGFSIAIVRPEGTVVNKCVNGNGVSLYNRAVSYRDLGTNLFINGTRFVFNRQFLLRNGLYFWVGMRHEDMDFMIRALFLAKKICLRQEVTYNYLVREGSIMSTINMKSFEDLLTILRSVDQMKLDKAHTKYEKKYFDLWLWRLLSIILAAKLFINGTTPEYELFVKKNSFYFRKIALRSVAVCLVSGNIKDSFMAIVATLKPLWLNKLFMCYQRRK